MAACYDDDVNDVTVPYVAYIWPRHVTEVDEKTAITEALL